VGNFSESTLLLFLHELLHFFLRVFDFKIIFLLLHALAFVINLVSFLIAFISNAVVFKVSFEFSKSNELFVADIVFTLFKVLSLELFVFLNFRENHF